MKKVFIILSLVSIFGFGFYLTGCATITTGTTQLVTITCNVEGATIKLDGQFIGKTPFTGEIEKNCNIITIEKKGYKTHTIALSTTLEGLFWGNIITGGTVGSITDFASGAAYKYSPASFQVELYSDKISMLEYRKIFELRKFAMLNMSNIAIDLSNNSGFFLESLTYLAKLDDKANASDIIREKLIASDGDQLRFGNLMVDLLDVQL